MRWIKHPAPRWAALLALCAANIVLILCIHPRVRAQQRPLQPGAAGYAEPPVPAPPDKPAATPSPAAPADAAPARRITLPPVAQRTIIVLDPAHGGPETGAQINDHLAEKDVVLALAMRIRATLQSHNFTVVSTRDGDPAAGLTTNQRAEIANHTAAIACIVLHATATGNGVHLYTSSLAQADTHHGILSWGTAQSAFADQSTALQKELNTAFTHAQIATVDAQADVAPLDNLTCPAIAVEIAPDLAAGASNTIDVSDADYQQHVAETIATALVFWRGHFNASAGGAQ